MRVMAVFVGVSIPSALVNSGLKYMQVRSRDWLVGRTWAGSKLLGDLLL